MPVRDRRMIPGRTTMPPKSLRVIPGKRVSSQRVAAQIPCNHYYYSCTSELKKLGASEYGCLHIALHLRFVTRFHNARAQSDPFSHNNIPQSALCLRDDVSLPQACISCYLRPGMAAYGPYPAVAGLRSARISISKLNTSSPYWL